MTFACVKVLRRYALQFGLHEWQRQNEVLLLEPSFDLERKIGSIAVIGTGERMEVFSAKFLVSFPLNVLCGERDVE